MELIGLAIALTVAAWVLGGLILRAGGLVAGAASIVALAVYGDPSALVVLAAALALWLAGHWHFALRHRAWKSPLARAVLARLPLIRDPAGGWLANRV